MSNMDCGNKNKASRQNDVISYFQKPQSNNPHPIHASSFLEQGIFERHVNMFENAYATHTMDGKIHSSNDQSETNAFSSEIGSSNVEYFSLQGDTMHSWKMKKGQWDIRIKFKFDRVSRYPFIEPIPPANENETSRDFKCISCSWKLGKVVKLQMKLDTIEKHVENVYDKKVANDEKKNIARWKSLNECQHL